MNSGSQDYIISFAFLNIFVFFSSPSNQNLIHALSTPVESSQHTKLYVSDSFKFDPYLDSTILKISFWRTSKLILTDLFLSLPLFFLKKQVPNSSLSPPFSHMICIQELLIWAPSSNLIFSNLTFFYLDFQIVFSQTTKEDIAHLN